MLTILPEKDKQLMISVFNGREEGSRDPAVLVARDGEKTLGHIAVRVRERTLWIVDFSLAQIDDYTALQGENRRLADYLIKAAASYAMNRNVFRMESDVEKIYPLLKDFGFLDFNKNVCVDLAHLIKKCGIC